MQGLSPPVNRSEEDFDPGADDHVAYNSQYIWLVNYLNTINVGYMYVLCAIIFGIHAFN